MGRIIRIIFLVIVFLSIYIYGTLVIEEWQMSQQKIEQKNDGEVLKVKKKEQNTKISQDSVLGLLEEKEEKVLKKYGEPIRIDKSDYGYEWWIYNDVENYIQIGIKDKKVSTVFVAGENVNIKPFKIGQRYEELYSQELPVSEMKFTYQDNSYQMNLLEEDLFERPLFKVGNVWVQLYFDKFTHLLSSVRLMNTEVLLLQKPYELIYSGSLPTSDSPREDLLVQQGNERQIFDFTNVIRYRNGLPLFTWNEEVSEMAFRHSEDMKINQFFDHVSPNTGDLKNRLQNQDIVYSLAGENISYNYTDGVAAVEGWMNSEGHRVNMLNKEFTELGVGAFEKYFTQNFLTP